MAKQADGLDISQQQRRELEGLVRKGSTAQQVVLRARIVLLAAEGHSNSEIARLLDTSRPTVLLWRQRFGEEGVAGLLHNAPGQGRPRTLKAKKEEQVIQVTLTTKPKAATHWSTRTLGEKLGLSKSTVWRLWRQHDLQPHRVQSFKYSRDPQFIEKLHDVVGLYLNPPDKALLLAVDEKSQIQALERSQPILPLRAGLPESRTHDYKRHGTTTLFAALNVLDGKVIGQCLPRHRHQEFLKFLKTIDQQTPPPLDLHLIVDNYSTHKHAKVTRWLKRHPRFHLHFTPTSCSWLNLVESWFSQLTAQRIRRDSFTNVPMLIQTINDYIAHNNQQPKPFVWTATPQAILSKLKYRKENYEASH
jgi:transposase